MTLLNAVAIVGPNASGKSALAIRLASEFGGEIISADSRQIYRGFDLCSGKVTDDESKGIAHHLMSFLDIEESYDPFRFQNDCNLCMEDIAARGKIPFIVGGSGQYIDAVVQGYAFSDVPPNDILREKLEPLALNKLIDILRDIQPTAIPLLDTSNRRRLIRAIEIASTGVDYATTRKAFPKHRFLLIGILWGREEIRHRIRVRLHQRIAAGMIDEVKVAINNGVPPKRLIALGLEYREIFRYLQGDLKTMIDLENILALRIGQFSKRQMTWFRKNHNIHWIAGADLEASQPHELVSRFLAGYDA